VIVVVLGAFRTLICMSPNSLNARRCLERERDLERSCAKREFMESLLYISVIFIGFLETVRDPWMKLLVIDPCADVNYIKQK
jgi:hypothetical protein